MAMPSTVVCGNSAAAKRRMGLVLSLVILLVAESSRGLMVSSMFTFIKKLADGDGKVATRVTATAVSLFSVGRLVAAPALGYMCDRFSFRATFLFCLLLSVVGHGLYALAPNYGSSGASLAALVVARGVVGLGSGVLGVSRAVIATLTAPDERLAWFSALSVAKFIGYALAPTIAVFITVSDRLGILDVDQYTAPAEILALLNLALAPVVWLLLDPRLGKPEKDAPLPAVSGELTGLDIKQAPPAAAPLTLQLRHNSLEAALLPRRTSSLSSRPLFIASDRARSPSPFAADKARSPSLDTDPLLPSSSPLGASRAGGARRGASAGIGASSRDRAPSSGRPQQPPSRTPSLFAEALEAEILASPVPAAPPTPPPSPGFLSDPVILSGIALFVTLNGVSKGVLTLMEAVATPMFQHTFPSSQANLVNQTALWFAQLGAGGLLVYVFVALPRKSWSWAPSDLTLLIVSALATAAGSFVLAHPWDPNEDSLVMPLLDSGAALVWSVGAPIADVVAVSCFSVVVQGKAQGAWMGTITMAGSVGRISFPLLTLFLSQQATLMIAAVLSLLGAPAVVAYRLFKARRERQAAAALSVKLGAGEAAFGEDEASIPLDLSAAGAGEGGGGGRSTPSMGPDRWGAEDDGTRGDGGSSAPSSFIDTMLQRLKVRQLRSARKGAASSSGAAAAASPGHLGLGGEGASLLGSDSLAASAAGAPGCEEEGLEMANSSGPTVFARGRH